MVGEPESSIVYGCVLCQLGSLIGQCSVFADALTNQSGSRALQPQPPPRYGSICNSVFLVSRGKQDLAGLKRGAFLSLRHGPGHAPAPNMKTLIANKFAEAQIDRLKQLGCEVTYKPTVKAGELPQLISPYKILVMRSKEVTADTLKASDELALVLRAGAGVNTIDVKTASAGGACVSKC